MVANELVWTKRAQHYMKQVLDYISGDSAKNARKVVEEIIIAATKAIAAPGIYPPDKYRINNN